jgi:2-haloacid dehalogenase
LPFRIVLFRNNNELIDYKLRNSPEMTLKKKIKNSQLTSYFERLLSVDAIKKYKPAKETYLWAAAELAVSPNEMLMVAAHGWDIAGASYAGLATCFVARKGQSMYPLSAAPDYWATDILDLAQQLVAEYS